MRTWTRLAAPAAAVVLLASFAGQDDPGQSAEGAATAARPADSPAVSIIGSPAGRPAVSPSLGAAPGPAPSTSASPVGRSRVAPAAPRAAAPAASARARSALLMPAPGGDGDSWRDTAGREYRLGLVNTPEYNECFGREATAERKRLTAGGFRASIYTNDRYGRGVSVVTTAAGLNLNVHLARYGFANDTYLSRYRSENPSLARQLDAAFAAARAESRGLWSACSGARSAAAPAPATAGSPRGTAAAGGCHPDYVTCLPVQGDGSGRGEANDLDCSSIDGPVQLRRAGVDPYRLDADGDGVGCDA